MLVGLTRVGASPQTITKHFFVEGADLDRLAAAARRGLRRGGPVAVELADESSGRFTGTSAGWLGTRAARDEAFSHWAAALTELSDLAESCGGTLVVPGVALGPTAKVLAGDLHLLCVESEVEQEVLFNLLRTVTPLLIALAGRGFVRPGQPPDVVGSRWLSESRTHLTTHYLASTSPEHLQRVRSDLRRRYGVAELGRMDVSPSEEGASRSVTVRCLDAAPSLASTRAQALVVAALGLSARRRIRDGGRVGHTPQRMLEENRARAVAYGLRARITEPDPSARKADDQATVAGPAEDAARALLVSLAVEFRNLEADAEELAPLLLAVDLTSFGGGRDGGERSQLDRWAADGHRELASGIRRGLLDPGAGGPLLAEIRRRNPGLVAAVLQSWDERIAAARAAPSQAPTS